ncbi:aldehyde dehydrogenase family protein [Cupriavidus taiwanensis]|uniref:NAD-dependent aldehyde dehydrogenase n=1 Tax=Cupriavidus taiwanensis (strain DSM 17343 / BCRC 17206 / CCUG 44338 / CIP 107171 / LMG 19424 / R1) TaxID=977880 RepID=B3R4G3_CUPTR|nr:aldehyde dehydrogenase family protein [Cupriavidus taiwanensis]CAQ69195.1 putative NAD-dependent aldehyde dehydrogenase [Cupriavidus taiwanensis LMG 19424]
MRYQNYINGRWVDSEQHDPNRNPSDLSDLVGEAAIATPALAQEAIAAASAAFGAWSESPVQLRADILARVGHEIVDRKDELGRLLAREEGKTLREAIGEVMRAGQIFKYFAQEALRPHGQLVASVRPGIDVEVTAEPVGVVSIITPWNFPIAIPAWKLAPALAFGNCVVFKPAELVPGSAWALAEILSRSGLPDGVFNMVLGRGTELGPVLTTSPDVAAVSFTGSEATGRRIAQALGGTSTRLQLEMGGKNPLVVLGDADIAVAVDAAVQGAFYSTGQRCTASSRIIVTDDIHDRFTRALREATQRLRVGHALDDATDIGPVADASQLDKDLGYVALGRQEGAVLACGGERLRCASDGFYLAPALFLECESGMRVAQEEIFGPVATVLRARDHDHALELANDTPFGLSAGVCTRSLSAARRFRRQLRAGMVMVNTATAGVDYHVPFGGIRASSYGPHEQGWAAREFFTAGKTSYIRA